MNCKHITLSCVSLLICVSQTISIGTLNFFSFTLRKCVLVCKSLLDNLSLLLVILELITFNQQILQFLGWFHPHPCQNYSMPVILERIGKSKRLDQTHFVTQFFKSILFLQNYLLLSLCNLEGEVLTFLITNTNKSIVENLNRSINICKTFILIPDDGCFILLTNSIFYVNLQQF